MESTDATNNNSNLPNTSIENDKPNMSEFLHKHWKWIKYESFQQGFENKIWSQDPLAIDGPYNIIISECLKGIDDYNHEKLSILSKYFDKDLNSKTKDELKKDINCVDLTERMMLKKFQTEYFSLYECKNQCMYKLPHGIQNSLSRQRCYRECGQVFNTRVQSFS